LKNDGYSVFRSTGGDPPESVLGGTKEEGKLGRKLDSSRKMRRKENEARGLIILLEI